MQLRNYQINFINAVRTSWAAGNRNVLAVLPTGAGKTVCFSEIIAGHTGRAIAIAHRQELVAQISVALSIRCIPHQIIGPSDVVKFAIARQVEETGTSFYRVGAPVTVAGVDTLRSRREKLRDWMRGISLWVQDEAHHITQKNKWGNVLDMFPNAIGLGVTATPCRTDGKGLGADSDGVFNDLVIGVGMRDLIHSGYLTDYRVFAPLTDIDLTDVTTAADGDYNKPRLKAAVRKSRIVGDVVEHYQRIAPGRLGVTFVTDTDTAADIAGAYNAAGIPAEVVTYRTPGPTRQAILRRFRRREILQLVNVDLFGEGFDLPAIEVVSFARPTQSYGLYCQQFGRALRILDGKREAIIIDHVGNVMRHGLPDAPRRWSLDRRDKRARRDPDVIPVRYCPQCTSAYERYHRVCPYCGFYPEPAARNAPEHVDGDLGELDAETLARLRGDVAAANVSVDDYREWITGLGQPTPIARRNIRIHREKLSYRDMLRDAMAVWGGRHAGATDAEIQRRFYLAFGVDVLTAQTLSGNDTVSLTESILRSM